MAKRKRNKVVAPVNLDRFAGSSEEEEDVENQETKIVTTKASSSSTKATKKQKSPEKQPNKQIKKKPLLEDTKPEPVVEKPKIDNDYDADYGSAIEEDDDSIVGRDDEFLTLPVAAADSKEDEDEDDKFIIRDDDKDSDADNDNAIIEKNKDTFTIDNNNINTPDTGMASAMARILATNTNAVLSKTVTPLQKQQEKERLEQKALQERRKSNMHEKKLEALHKPMAAGDGISQEIEQERLHRRVATRGVVALFNAIAKHQKTLGVVDDDKVDNGGSKSVASTANTSGKTTKYSFLDMIRSKAMSRVGGGGKETKGSSVADDRQKPKWNALQDDYMLKANKDLLKDDDQ